MNARDAALPAALLALPPDVLAALVELLPDPVAEVRLRQQLCQEIGREAYERGYLAGYERGARLREADPLKLDPNAPSFADLELLRWGPGGREHFGDPRPTDRYPLTRLEAAS